MNKLIVAFCVLLAVSETNAQQSSEEQFLQSRGSKIDAQMPQKQEQLNDLRKELALKKKTLSGIRSKIATVEQQIEKASKDLSRSSFALSGASKRLDAINDQLANSEKENEEAQLSIVKSSRRNQQLQEQLVQEQISRDQALNDFEPAVSGAPETAIATDAKPSVVVVKPLEIAIVKREPSKPEFGRAVAPQDGLAESDSDSASKSLENMPEAEPRESVDEAVVASASDDNQGETAITEKDNKGGAVTKSAKAGGEFVKKETKSVVSSAAKTAVRKGIKGVLGL